MSTILVTGGTGFIGSHTCVGLLTEGYKLIMLDSFANSSFSSLLRLKKLISRINPSLLSNLEFVECDIRNFKKLNNVFKQTIQKGNPIEGVIHFAGLKAVRESIEFPLNYYENNIVGTITLINVMEQNNCRTIIFSSSASVYGNSRKLLIDEKTKVNPINPYAITKSVVENLLQNIFESKKNNWRIINLRYFNPIGAHPSGLIGEDPLGIPNNLFPKLVEVASGRIKKIQIFGSDWDTPDGTGIRDYIHVMDLADGHVSALKYLFERKRKFINLNLGTGKGYSVLELISTFSEVNKVKVPYEITLKR